MPALTDAATPAAARTLRSRAAARRRRTPTPPSRWWERGFALLAVLLVAGRFGLPWLDRRFPPPLDVPPPSVVVVDAAGAPLTAYTDQAGRWRLPVALGEVDRRFVDLLIAFEDRRFATHAGVDPLAVLRALGQLATTGHVVSGASTLTMQTVRLVTDARSRTPLRKLVEVLRALQVERRLSKDEILQLYLDTAPYGGNIEGVRAASLAYFGREPARLTLAQAALLIALPQSPEQRRPDRFPAAARVARDRVIDRLLAAGAISARDAGEAKREAVPHGRRPVPRLAPHLSRALVAGDPTALRHATTLDRDWQAALESLAGTSVDRIGPNVSAAIVVAELDTGKIRALIGSAKFLDARRAGHVDMTTAIRSPGSTLKPFIYGLAMEAGMIAPGTLLDDTPTSFDGYQPDNFDEEFHGQLTASEALRQSLNIPAVTLLDAIGPVRLAVRLREAGAAVDIPPAYGPTLAIALGGFGTRLVDLAALYTAIATDGRPVPLYASGTQPAAGARLLDARAAHDVAHILDRMAPPKNARPGEIAYKTGTSYGHRDAWAIGFDARHVVAVWIGRPDGTPVAELTGWTDAAPLLFDAFARIGVAPRPAPPQEVATADLPLPLRAFLPRSNGVVRSPDALTIAFPPKGATLSLGGPDGTRAPLVARVLGRAVDAWLLDGRPVEATARRKSASIAVEPGRHTLTVVTADGESQRVDFSVE